METKQYNRHATDTSLLMGLLISLIMLVSCGNHREKTNDAPKIQSDSIVEVVNSVEEPIKGAEQYCEELAEFAASNDYNKADELTRKYLDNYDENDMYVFLIELKRQLSISEKHHLGVFISNADGSKYPNLMELMRRVIAASEAEKSGVQYTASGSEKAALFCSILIDLSKEQNYDKAKSLMKRFVNDYVIEFYSDGSVNLDDNRFEECKQFCLSFKKNMTPEIYEFLSSEGMKSEEYTQFQLMCVAGLQAAEEK